MMTFIYSAKKKKLKHRIVKMETGGQINEEKLAVIVKEEKKLQLWAFASIFIVCVIIGTPLWWKTTEVYRATIPHSTITEQSKLQDVVLKMGVDVVVWEGLYEHKNLVEDLSTDLQNIFDNEENSELNDLIIDKDLCVEWSGEKVVSKDIEDLEKRLASWKPHGTISFLVLPQDSFKQDMPEVVVGLYRNVYIKFSESAKMAESINYVLEKYYIRRPSLTSVQDHDERIKMTSFPTTPHLNIIFTLAQSSNLFHWSPQLPLKEHVEPMLNDLHPFINFTLSTQMIHLVSIASRHSKLHDGHTLSWDRHPYIINPIEPYLSSHATEHPIINFVTYIPSPQQSPLRILLSSGEASRTNSFLVPRWGGILVENVNRSRGDEVAMQRLLGVFSLQLKALLGFQRPSFYQDRRVKFLTSPNKLIPNWELDSWLMHRTITNILTSTSSMTSLQQLLTLIHNIVINDQVANQIFISTNSTAETLELMKEGRLYEAHLASLTAFKSSEVAFFDHSLLELLYFPEDQKFAIYLPLFFPLSIPILASSVKIIRSWRQKDV